MEVTVEYDTEHNDKVVIVYPENSEELYDLVEFLQDHGCMIDGEQ